LSHNIYFGDSDRSHHHKEVAFFEDMHVLKPGQFIPGPSKKEGKTTVVQSAVFNIMVAGAEVWHNGKFKEYIWATTYNPAPGYPVSEQCTTLDEVQHRLQMDTVFDDVMVNLLEYDTLEDLDDKAVSSSYPGLDGFGGTDNL
jgi:hypothetical protein